MDTIQEFTLLNREFCELNPVIFGQERCTPGHAYGPTTRFHYLIHYIVSGEGIFHRDGQEYTLHAGQCFIILPHQTTYYRASTQNPWHYIWLGFTTSLPLPERMTAPVLESETASRLFPEMLKYLEAGVKQPEIYLTARLWELYSHFTCQSPEPKHTETLMLRAKNVIENEYMNEITVSGLADRLHLERSYFSTLFKKQFGISPQVYLVEHRLEVAALLLTEHQYTPTLAARAVGYSDLCNFSRMFRKKYGMAPSEYAKKMKT